MAWGRHRVSVWGALWGCGLAWGRHRVSVWGALYLGPGQPVLHLLCLLPLSSWGRQRLAWKASRRGTESRGFGRGTSAELQYGLGCICIAPCIEASSRAKPHPHVSPTPPRVAHTPHPHVSPTPSHGGLLVQAPVPLGLCPLVRHAPGRDGPCAGGSCLVSRGGFPCVHVHATSFTKDLLTWWTWLGQGP